VSSRKVGPPEETDPSIATVDDGIPLFQPAASAGFRDEERWWEWRDRARPLPGPRLHRLVPAHHLADGRGRILDDPAPRHSRRGSSTGPGCLIPLTVNEIRRLFNRVVCPVRHTLLHVWHWSNWRRINQPEPASAITHVDITHCRCSTKKCCRRAELRLGRGADADPDVDQHSHQGVHLTIPERDTP